MAGSKPSLTPLGRPMKAHFLYHPSYTPLNHGAFGAYPEPVRARLRQCQDLCEERPDPFFRYQLPKLLGSSRKAIAEFLGVDADECVFVPNATTGVNTVLRSLVFGRGDVVVYFSTLYSGCVKTLEYMKESTAVEGACVELEYPVSDDEVVRRFCEKIRELKEDGRRPKIAMFDTVSSLPGVRVPWERLVEICRKEGILSMIDGAHGVGHMRLDLARTQPDFFVSNLHKWLFVPRGCALLYVAKHSQHLIRSSLPTSHGYEPLMSEDQDPIFNPLPTTEQTRFVGLFSFVATSDNSSYLCVETALKFRQEVCGGEEKIMEYCQNICREGGKKVAEILGTEVMENPEGTLTDCCFANIKLPLSIGIGAGEVKHEDAFKVVTYMDKVLIEEYDTFVAPYYHAGFFWVRYSGQIYLEVSDFVWSAGVLQKVCQRIEKGEYLKTKPLS